MNQTRLMPTVGEDINQNTYTIRAGIEGYVVTHNWREVRETSEAYKEQNGYYDVYNYKSDEFAYTTKEEAIAKLTELLA